MTFHTGSVVPENVNGLREERRGAAAAVYARGAIQEVEEQGAGPVPSQRSQEGRKWHLPSESSLRVRVSAEEEEGKGGGVERSTRRDMKVTMKETPPSLPPPFRTPPTTFSCI